MVDRVLEFGEPRRQVFNAVERGMLHDFALVLLNADCIAASNGARCSCIVFCVNQSSMGRQHAHAGVRVGDYTNLTICTS